MKIGNAINLRSYTANQPTPPAGDPNPTPNPNGQDGFTPSGDGGSGGKDPLKLIKAHGTFLGRTAGAAIGMGLAVTQGGYSPFFAPLLGAIGGGIIGGMLEDPSVEAELPAPLAYVKENASLIGGLTGLGVGLASAGGGSLFTSALFGTLGGVIVGNIISGS